MGAGVYNAASVAALVSAVVSVFTAAGAFLAARLPDWRDLKRLGWIAVTAAVNAALACAVSGDVSPAVWAASVRLELVLAALHLAAWHAYLSAWGKRPLSARQRRALGVVLAASLLALVPGAVYGEGSVLRPVGWLGMTHRDPVVTPLGWAVHALLVGAGAWVVVRTVRLGRAGAPWARTHVACTSALLAMGAHDALVACGLPLRTPYLVAFGLHAPMFVLAVVTLQRIATGASELHRLKAGLEEEASRRAEALARSEAALARAERLAMLGQLAAGVAHEVNNPTAVVSANLAYLGHALRDDPRPQLHGCIEDSQAAVVRIAAIVKQLLVAGRSVRSPDAPLSVVALARAFDAAVAAATARGAAHVDFVRELPSGLCVLAHADPLVQVLSNLVVNAVQAIPAARRGRVVLRGCAERDRVRIVVEDDGDGMSPETLRRLFEPFYSTKPVGAGTGLGLAVSRALVETMQGTLRFESEPGHGTRAILELAHADVAPLVTPPPGTIPVPAPRRSTILLVDDDGQVRHSLARLLGLRYDVTVADGVGAALDEAFGRTFDLVLCDVVMPDGGGERFWAEVSRSAPELARRVVFMTGGAATPAARAFLAAQPQPVLEKPIDLAAVDGAVTRLARLARAG
ncbi:hybrid sensor histidine kinase/response regulator [Anaeromyxobacter oryzae]|uniref:histidine kinase n=1 Tax=Anaeromyxobacter oryzae TaxID=2918170 RepID=A0ABM7WWA7_9BACT|nr:hybrid sensor histidine kinase/response regulator [Anaeromyxobacter oryzae]BDG03788.1 hypothetical protein AMOR_27840 [Anaeromyxobacter oryzae]